MKQRNALLAVLCALLLIAMASCALAELGRGTCGENLTWVLDDEGTLTISGNGDMENYLNLTSLPWYDVREQIQALVLKEGVTSIGYHAFMGLGIESVTIPSGVTRIGESAFHGCAGLSSVLLPEGLRTIESCAFHGCQSLTSLTIPPSVTDIYNGAFAYSGLTSLVLPDGLKYVAGNLFAHCESLESVTIPASVIQIELYAFSDCTKLTGVTIPEGVKRLGSSVFMSCTSLTSVNIPSGVTSIAEYAFRDCTSLTAVTVPSGVTSIGNYAFKGCTQAEITLPDGVASVGTGSFDGVKCIFCSPHSKTAASLYAASAAYRYCAPGCPDFLLYDADDITTLDQYTGAGGEAEIPAGVNVIAPEVFRNRSALTAITIPDSVTQIGSSAFLGCSGLTEVSIPAGVVSIGGYAFSDCTQVEITLPDGITSIDSSAFENVKQIYCRPQTATAAALYAAGTGYRYSIPGAEEFLLYDCNGETVLAEYVGAGGSVVVPDGVSSIASEAFINCSSLTSVVLPQSVTSIGDEAFSGCTQADVYLPDNVVSLSASSLADVKRVLCTPRTVTTATLYRQSILYRAPDCPDCLLSGDTSTAVVRGYDGESDSVTIPGGVTMIGGSAFKNCATLTRISMPEGVLSIGASAFYGCTALESAQLPSGLTDIGASAFYGCAALTAIAFPDSLTSIGSNAFTDCDSLPAVVLPENTTSVGSYAFSSCDGLARVELGGGLTDISEAMFSGCTSLTDVLFAENLTGIGDSAFLHCTSLRELTIPGTVTTIGKYAFNGCSGLLSASIPGSVLQIGSSAFSSCSSLERITLEKGLTGIGNSAFSDCTALEEVLIPESVASIDAKAFYRCTGLKRVTVSAGSTGIGESAFYGCSQADIYLPDTIDTIGTNALTGVKRLICSPQTTTTATLKKSGYSYRVAANPDCILKDDAGETMLTGYDGAGGSVVIPDCVTVINASAFNKRSTVTSVTVPQSVGSIGSSAFYRCTGLTDISLPESITSIADSTFMDCSSLQGIVIPGNVTSIGGYAFSGCTGLAEVTIPENVTDIGRNAFQGCSNARVYLHDNITSIGNGAFINGVTIICNPQTATTAALFVDNLPYYYWAPGYPDFKLTGGGTDVKVVRYSGSTKTVLIPPRVTQWSVGTKLGSLRLPATLDGSCSFSLTAANVTVPEGVTNLGALSLTGVQKLYLPDSVEAFDGLTFSGTVPLIYCSEGSAAQAWALFNGYETCTDSWESVCTLSYSGSIALDVGESLVLDAADFVISPIPQAYTGEIRLEAQGLAVEGMTVTAEAPGDATLTAWMDDRFTVVIPVHVYQAVERIALAAPTICQAGTTFTVSAEIYPADTSGRLTWYQDDVQVCVGQSCTLTAPEGMTATVVRAVAPSGVSSQAVVRIPQSISDPYLRSSVVECGSLLELCVDIDGETFVNDPTTYGRIVLGAGTTGLTPEAGTLRATGVGRMAFSVESLSGTTKYLTVTVEDHLHAWRTQIPASPATCAGPGNTAYEICTGCGRFFDAQGIEIAEGSWVLPMTHVHHEEDGACRDCGRVFSLTGVGVMTLPAALEEIRSEAFAGVTARNIVVPDRCVTIGERAFADCTALRCIVLPAGLEGSVPGNAFEGCAEDLDIVFR